MKTHYKPLVSILETKNSELVRAGRDDKKKTTRRNLRRPRLGRKSGSGQRNGPRIQWYLQYIEEHLVSKRFFF